jgi:hypothetical protein
MFCIQRHFFFEYREVCEIMWKNIAEPGRSQMTVWRMRNACWRYKATNTHSKYVIFIDFFTAKIVALTRFIVTFVRTLSVCLSVCLCLVVFMLSMFYKWSRGS